VSALRGGSNPRRRAMACENQSSSMTPHPSFHRARPPLRGSPRFASFPRRATRHRTAQGQGASSPRARPPRKARRPTRGGRQEGYRDETSRASVGPGSEVVPRARAPALTLPARRKSIHISSVRETRHVGVFCGLFRAGIAHPGTKGLREGHGRVHAMAERTRCRLFFRRPGGPRAINIWTDS
jgi:hypothetical protein